MAKQPSPTPFPRRATATLELRGTRLVVVAEDGTVDSIRVAAGGTLAFEAPAGSPFKWWSVLLKDATPFEDGTGWASDARGSQRGKRIATNANGGGANQRSYAYAVVASDGQKVYFRDPEVVVGPPPP